MVLDPPTNIFAACCLRNKGVIICISFIIHVYGFIFLKNFSVNSEALISTQLLTKLVTCASQNLNNTTTSMTIVDAMHGMLTFDQ